MSKSSKICILIILVFSLIISYNNIKSNFYNIDYAATKNNALDEALYLEISNSNDTKFIKQKFRDLVDKKKRNRNEYSKIFANHFKYELIQILILITLTVFISYQLFRKIK